MRSSGRFRCLLHQWVCTACLKNLCCVRILIVTSRGVQHIFIHPFCLDVRIIWFFYVFFLFWFGLGCSFLFVLRFRFKVYFYYSVYVRSNPVVPSFDVLFPSVDFSTICGNNSVWSCSRYLLVLLSTSFSCARALQVKAVSHIHIPFF